MKRLSFLLLSALFLLSAKSSAQTISEDNSTSSIIYDNIIVRIAEIEVYSQYLTEYLAFANEVDRLSM